MNLRIQVHTLEYIFRIVKNYINVIYEHEIRWTAKSSKVQSLNDKSRYM